MHDSIDALLARTDGTICIVGTSQGSAEFTDERITVAEMPATLQSGQTASIDGRNIERWVGAAATGNNCRVVGTPRARGGWGA